MAYTETLSAVKGNLVLNNGTSVSGATLKKNISIGTLNPSAWDLDKFANIAVALSPMMSKSLLSVQDVKTFDVQQQS